MSDDLIHLTTLQSQNPVEISAQDIIRVEPYRTLSFGTTISTRMYEYNVRASYEDVAKLVAEKSNRPLLQLTQVYAPFNKTSILVAADSIQDMRRVQETSGSSTALAVDNRVAVLHVKDTIAEITSGAKLLKRPEPAAQRPAFSGATVANPESTPA
ncbi:MAG: hypothetical protein WDO70_04355 [Alphaproteobacteria bacterium]